MATKRVSVDLEEPLYRRFKARVAYEDSTMSDVLSGLIEQWIDTWGSNTLLHTLEAGEDLRTMALRYYSDPELYLTIAYFNDITFVVTSLQPGAQVLIPEPGTAPAGLAPSTPIPWGVPKKTASIQIDEELYRRYKARTAFEGTTMTAWLYEFVIEWTGDWPTRTIDYTVTAGDTLRGLAFRFYSDSAKYEVIAHYNAVRTVDFILVGQQLIIPEPETCGELPPGESPYIFGIHDRGGEHLMADTGRKGWVLITEEIGRNPTDTSGRDYSSLENAGYGVLVRLNHGYHRGSSFPGTIPEQDASNQNYADFAVRCGNFAEHSSGCHIWIVGNEINHPAEWPGGEHGQPIIPERYADCFRRCRREIHRRQAHQDDQVVVGAIAPWPDKARYAGNERGDWIQYLADVLDLLKGACDGIALHTYTHGADRRLITSHDRMDPPFQDRYYQFRTYREFMEAIPASMRSLPVYITETNQNDPWARRNTGWVQAAYAEIDKWNLNHTRQRIRCLLLYRWSLDDQWSFQGITEVQDDFRAALDHEYRWWR